MSDSRDRRRWLFRVTATVNAFARTADYPVSLGNIRTVNYFAALLGPHWGIDGLVGDVLKRDGIPRFRELDEAVVDLVCLGVLQFESGSPDYLSDEATLSAVPILSDQLISLQKTTTLFGSEARLLKELAVSVSGLGPELSGKAVSVDATYGDSVSGVRSVVALTVDAAGLEPRARRVVGQLESMLSERGPGGPVSDESIARYVRRIGELLRGKKL